MSYEAIVNVAKDNQKFGQDVDQTLQMIERSKPYDDSMTHLAARNLAASLRSVADDLEKAANELG